MGLKHTSSWKFHFSCLFSLISPLNKRFFHLFQAVIESPHCQTDLFLFPLFPQIFPLKVDPRWHGPPASQLSLALQQALAKELMRAKQGQIQQGGLAFRLLQAIAALLTSAHAGPIVMSMHRSHALSCPLMRQLHLYQVRLADNRCIIPCWFIKHWNLFFFFLFLVLDVCFFQRLVSQDIAFSSLFIKVIVEMLIWLDNPTVEGGPLKTLLKSFAGLNSHKHRHNDGEQLNSLSFQMLILYKQWLISFSALLCSAHRFPPPCWGFGIS